MFIRANIHQRHVSLQQTTGTPSANQPNTTQQDSTPNYIKALLQQGAAWFQAPGEPAQVTYWFPASETELAQVPARQAVEVDQSVGLSSIGADSTYVSKALALWESFANVVFVENETYQVPFFLFTQKDLTNEPIFVEGYGNVTNVNGFAFYVETDASGHQFSQGIGFNKDYVSSLAFRWGLTESKITTILHEIGHAFIGLKHPFGGNFSVTEPSEKFTTFSVMNYQTETRYTYLPFIPVTPMPRDIDAAQYRYGVNPRMGNGDDVYFVRDLTCQQALLSWIYITPVASFPWDNNGIDTLNAQTARSDIILNLNPYSRSKVENTVLMMPNMKIENVVGGRWRNKIVLNSLDNIVDIRQAAKAATIIVDPTACGLDTIVGFKPNKDRLIVQRPDNLMPLWQANPVEHQQVNLNGETIAFDFGVKIEFDKNNSVVIAGVRPDKINTIHVDTKTTSEIETLLWDLVFNLPKELVEDFSDAFIQGAAITFMLCLSEEALKKYGCTENQRAAVNQVIQCILIFFTGNFLSSGLGFLATSLARYFDYTEEHCRIIGLSVAKIIQSTQNIVSPIQVTNLLASLLGNEMGCRLSLWLTNKIITLCKEQKYMNNSSWSVSTNRFSLWAHSAKEKLASCLWSRDETYEEKAALELVALGKYGV